MKIALVQRNYTVGDLRGNADLIAEFTGRPACTEIGTGWRMPNVRTDLET
jgi:hypothetical protein